MGIFNKFFSITKDINTGYKIFYILGLKFKFSRADIYHNQKINNIYSKLNNIEIRFQKIENWINNFYKNRPEYYPISLSKNEQNILCKYYSKTRNCLEFGSGGSTFLALLNSDCFVYSVESDKFWIDYLKSYKIINTSENKRLKLIYADIGETGAWGYPLNNDNTEKFTNYHEKVFENFNAKEIDMVFVDGRFRVACVLSTILHCSDNIDILIHDYTFREEYHVVEEFLDLINTVDSLCIFKIKNNIDKEKVRKLYKQYKLVTK